MTDDVGLLSQHSKKSYEASSFVSDTAQQQQRLYAALARLVTAGFHVDVDASGRLAVWPAKLLTAAQRDWLKQHKPELAAAVSTPCRRWCIEYPAGPRCVADYLPATDWRRVSAEYPGAAVWPAPDGLDVAAWIGEGTPQNPLETPPEAREERGYPTRPPPPEPR